MKINNILKLGISIVALSSTFSFAAEIETNSALMQSMDKVTGRVSKITVPVNSKISYGDFSLVLRACKKRPAEETPENFAFVDVTDKSFGKDEYNIFRGWMLSSAPGINSIEHPIYDVWLLECVDSDISNVSLLTKEELDARDNLPSKSSLKNMNKEELIDNKDVKEKDKPRTIHIKDFIQEDRDIEKEIKVIEAGVNNMLNNDEDAPENLLKHTNYNDNASEINGDDLSEEIDKEIKMLNGN